MLGYLNPNDYTKYEDGTSAPITTVGKDVMVEFPKRGYKITTENNIVKIPLYVSFDDEIYKDGVDIDTGKLHEMVKEKKKLL